MLRPFLLGIIAVPNKTYEEIQIIWIFAVAFRRALALIQRWLWVVSSVGRASRLHRECREFEPLTTHHFQGTYELLDSGDKPLYEGRTTTTAVVLRGCSSVG